jgi:hypothetical protein
MTQQKGSAIKTMDWIPETALVSLRGNCYKDTLMAINQKVSPFFFL